VIVVATTLIFGTFMKLAEKVLLGKKDEHVEEPVNEADTSEKKNDVKITANNLE
jgi:hypothetical protein